MKALGTKIFVILFGSIFTATLTLASVLPGSIVRDSKQFTKEQKFLVWDMEDIATAQGWADVGSILSYVLVPETEKTYWALNRELVLSKINLKSNLFVGHWPINVQNSFHIFEEIRKRYEENHLPLPTEYSLIGRGQIGCYVNHPLRFGDLNGDASSEVVLFLKNNLVLFSPEKGRVIFSENLSVLDWLTQEETAKEAEYKQIPGPSPYQYLSSVLSDAPVFAPGYRGYSKLYFGDFDSDNNPDILVWRKLYESHKTGDIPGFKKLHDTYAQYELNLGSDGGAFELQETDGSTIQQWLSGASYTWQKGYPSKSECPGEEGMLIPEMHDPLLNDPDVLQ